MTWPACGEIDIIEWIGAYDADHFQTNQWGTGGFPVAQNSTIRIDYAADAGPEQWHTYGVRFDDTTITFTYDGVDVGSKEYDNADGHGHRIIINVAVGGDMGGAIAPRRFQFVANLSVASH